MKGIKKAPICFEPLLKTVIWGGDKICEFKGIESSQPKIGESWEISAISGHESIVNEGVYKGLSLPRLVELFGEELLGKKSIEKYGLKFPLLIKLIDANDNLSVQVHPDDRLAAERHNSLGKTEMWYIIRTEQDARIYSGMKNKLTKEEYEQHVADNSFINDVASHASRPGDVFFLPAGRVHAIGAGNFLAEIQESSDITYRIYDYDRRDADGNPRELHTSLAKDAIDFEVYDSYKEPPVPEDAGDYKLISCDHFTARRVIVDGKNVINLPDDSFTVLMCVKGKAKISAPEGKVTLNEGYTTLIPANTASIIAEGKATLLLTSV